MAVVVVVTHSNFKCHGHDRFRLRARLISFVKYKGGGGSCFYERNLKRLTNSDRYNIIIRYRNEKRKRISEKTTLDARKNHSLTLPYINIIIIRIYTYTYTHTLVTYTQRSLLYADEMDVTCVHVVCTYGA